MQTLTMILSPEETQALLQAIDVSQGQDGTAITVMTGEGQYGIYASLTARKASPSKNGGGQAASAPQASGGYGQRAPAKKFAFKAKQIG